MHKRMVMLGLGAVLALAGCAGLPLYEVPAKISQPAPGDLRLDEVKGDPQASFGAPVRWGGVIAGVAVTADGAKVEIEERPLGEQGSPRRDGPPGSRFLVLAASTVDPAAYALGLEVTVAGTVNGSAVAVSAGQPALPVVEVEEYFVWRAEPVYAYYPPAYLAYPPYYGYPYGTRSPYWPYYPYGFRPYIRFGFGYHN